MKSIIKIIVYPMALLFRLIEKIVDAINEINNNN